MSIKKHSRRVCTCTNPQLQGSKAGEDEGPGWVSGYTAIWDNVDLQREIMRKGSFSKSINESVPKGVVKLMTRHFAHGGDIADMVGTVGKMNEDKTGLWFHADFDDDADSQKVRSKVVAKKVQFASVGFRPIKWGFITVDGKDIIEHTESKILESTLTIQPANPLAVLTGAKSADGQSPFAQLETVMSLDPSNATKDEVHAFLEKEFGSVAEVKEVLKQGKTFLKYMKRLEDLVALEPDAGAEDSAGKRAAEAEAHHSLQKDYEMVRLRTLATLAELS